MLFQKHHDLFRLWLSPLTGEDHGRLLPVRDGFEILNLSGRSKKQSEEMNNPCSTSLTRWENCYETTYPGCTEQVGYPAVIV